MRTEHKDLPQARRRRVPLWFAAAIVATCWTSGVARAETAIVAVATNFSKAATEVVESFEAATPHRITVTFGSTGKLYAQILSGAPFDAFLAADQARPRDLSRQSIAIGASQFTYAVGRLMLWTADPLIKAPHFRAALGAPLAGALAIANPKLAPYGMAARQTLVKSKLWERIKDRIVMGQNIGQTLSLVATGNAAFGFVARGQLVTKAGRDLKGRQWPVPDSFHNPIRQDAVLLARASQNKAAQEFLRYLRGAKARAILSRLGYKSANE